MMSLIEKFFTPNTQNKVKDSARIRENFIAHFFSLPEHSWIESTYSHGHFKQLINHLPSQLLQKLMTSYPVIFIPSSSLEMSNYKTSLTNKIIIYPEFQKLLNSSRKAAVAYLAHEIAFLLFELEEKSRDFLLAEIEADKFVCDIGLSEELEEFLLMLDETVEKRVRLTYLTINHFSPT